MIENFKSPVTQPYTITQTYDEHLAYAASHPEITYNGGIDLYSAMREICAAFPGSVEKVAFQANGYGNYIMLRHEWGFSLYAHLDRLCVNVGERVAAGDLIGIMGSSGFSTGVHLHFEMRDLSGKVIDPSEFFNGTISAPDNAHSQLTAISAPDGGNLRAEPLGDYITTIPFGTIGKIIGGPVYKYGLVCYQVEFPVTGWMAEKDHYGTKILEDYGTDR